MSDADRVRDEQRTTIALLEAANRFQAGLLVGMLLGAGVTLLGGLLLWR